MRAIKQVIKICVLIIICEIAFPSCTGEDVPDYNSGSPAQVKIVFNSGSFPVQMLTRAAITVGEENKVHNLYVFIFNPDGTLSTRKFFAYDALNNKVEGVNTSGNVTLQTTSGEKTICILANVGDKQPVQEISTATLDGISTLDGLKQLIISAKTGIQTIDRTDGKLLMSGKLENQNISSGSNSFNVPLKRVCSKVQFTIQKGASITSFTPLRWRVMRAPLDVRLMEDTGAGNANGGVTENDRFFDTEWRKFETTTAEQGSFTYYQVENRKAPSQSIQGSGDAAYNLREKQVKTPTGVGGNVTNEGFLYADDNATYVVIEGRLEMAGGVFADVRYMVHLGYIGQNANDFDCKRNTFYQYTVTVNGVSSIKTEAIATDAAEAVPGAEGKILETSTSFIFDCHYATCVVKFNKTIADAPEPFYVNTPFEQHGTTDIKWAKFMHNPPTAPNTVQTYPGETDNRLLDPAEMVARIKLAKTNNEANFFDANNDAHFTLFINEFYYDKHPITGVVSDDLWKQFVNEHDRELVLAGNYKVSKDGKSTLTGDAYLIRQRSIKSAYDIGATTVAAGFEQFDENFGDWYDNTDDTNHGNDSKTDGWYNSVKDWKLTTTDPRSASWANTKNWSDFINLNQTTIPGTSTSYKNGRGGTYVLQGHNGIQLQGKARYACLARNRDLNGNGKIDKDEVRWYLPAINQMINIWIGSGNVTPEDQMYRDPAFYLGLQRYPYVLYLSSTATGAWGSNPQILWSKEGTSTGSLGKNGQGNGPANQAWLPMPSIEGGSDNSGSKILPLNKYYTRCIRNLGSSDVSVQPGSFIEWDATKRIISLVNSPGIQVDAGSYRSTKEVLLNGEYPYHTERQPQNKPAAKFQVATNLCGGNATTGTTYTWNQIRANSPCASYSENNNEADRGAWRMPNQRELQLMSMKNVIHPTEDNTSIAIRANTDYTYNGSLDLAGRDRAFVGRNGKNSGLGLANKTEGYHVRCVRDVKE